MSMWVYVSVYVYIYINIYIYVCVSVLLSVCSGLEAVMLSWILDMATSLHMLRVWPYFTFHFIREKSKENESTLSVYVYVMSDEPTEPEHLQ